MSVEEYVERIEKYAYEHDVDRLNMEIDGMISELILLIESESEESVKIINDVLGYVNIALENKDYVLCGDILRNELINAINHN